MYRYQGFHEDFSRENHDDISSLESGLSPKISATEPSILQPIPRKMLSSTCLELLLEKNEDEKSKEEIEPQKNPAITKIRFFIPPKISSATATFMSLNKILV